MEKQFIPSEKIYDDLDNDKAELILFQSDLHFESASNFLKRLKNKVYVLISFIFIVVSLSITKFIEILSATESIPFSNEILVFLGVNIILNACIAIYLVLTSYLPEPDFPLGRSPKRIMSEDLVNQPLHIFKAWLAVSLDVPLARISDKCSKLGKNIEYSIWALIISLVFSIIASGLVLFF